MGRSWVILGAGNQARETAEYIELNGDDVTRFLVDEAYVAQAPESIREKVRALQGNEAIDLASVPAVLGVGYPQIKRIMVQAWPGITFGVVVSNDAWLARDVSIGDGSVVAARAAVSINVALGKHVLVNIGATISHDCTIGDYSTLSPGSHLAGNVTIGEGVFVGIGASVIEGLTIGEGSLIAAGAVVTRDVPAHTMVAGVPAKVKREQPDWP